jgi:hypothetical protein
MTDTRSRTVRRALDADSEATLPFEWRWPVKYLPLALCGGFFAFSVLWLAIGPLDWHIQNLPLVYAFLGACLLALVGGYVWGIKKPDSARSAPRRASVLTPNRLVIAAGIVALVLYFPTSYATTGNWIPDVVGALSNPGDAYRTTKFLNDTTDPTIHYVRFILSPLLITAAPVTYFLWPRLSWVARAFGLATILGMVALTIAQGINKGMAELTAYTCLFLALVAASSLTKGRRRRLVAAIVAAALVIGVFVSYYALSIESRRAGDVERAAAESSQTTPGDDSADGTGPSDSSSATPNPAPDTSDSETPPSDEEVAEAVDTGATFGIATERKGHFIYSLQGGLHASAITLSSYATHAYYGLSLALQESWTPTYGLGFSEFVRHNAAKFLGGEEFEKSIVAETYAGKISEKGWPVGEVWATFFVHPASDISFPGVVLLIGAIGFAFARSWRDTVMKGDPLAATVFYCLCVLVFYLPANNQLFQGGESAIGFSVVFIAWVVLRRRARRDRPVSRVV